MKRVPRTSSRYLLRSRPLGGGHGGSREHSAPATATPPTSKVRHPSLLTPEQRHVHLRRSNTVKAPSPRISSRPPSSSTTIYVAIFQGPQLKSPSVPFC
eukprot:1149506-Pelagomonas_calceolata.AAC.1